MRNGVRARFHALVDHAGLDEHRARDWVVVRMLNNALLAAPGRAGAPSGSRPTEEYLTMCIAIAKAVQD